MSGHERERLSAYLDGELDPRARAEVEAHLTACDACSELLARLAATDSALAQLPAEAPPGYFDGFAARVLARIEVARPKGRRRVAVPVWAWAAAAALVLAVLTPVTLREGRSPGVRFSEESARPAAGDASSPAGPASRLAQEASRDAVARGTADKSDLSEQLLRRDAARDARQELASAPREREETKVVTAEVSDEEAVVAAAAPAPAGVGRSQSLEGTAPAVPPQPVGPRERAAVLAASAERAAQLEATLDSERAAGSREKTAANRVEPRGSTVAGVGAEAFRRLGAERPQTVEEWRALREKWRAFVRAYPASPFADEARVRAVEACREAYRVGAAEGDAAQLRRDVIEYLALPDALQRARVERAAEVLETP